MEPITRSEMLMDGQYVEPKTRKEKILAGEDLEPVTREEYFLKEYRHSGGDVDVVQLTATENKTYTAPEGKAYNPVKVNVPEPVLDSITINENGHFTPPAGTDGYDDITVYVPYVSQGTTINDNGTYTPPSGVDGFSRVIVDVPTPPPSLQSLTASHNGYFVPSSGYDGFDEVTVEVATPLETLSATENGTYTPSSGYEGFSEVTVDVPLPNNAYLLESQKDDVVTIQHGAEFDMPRLIASIEPQQDLHGYDSPWVGGAGKNKISPNLSDWTKGNPYRYFKIPNFTDSIYVMSVVDNDTSVDLTGANVGFMNNYPDDSVEYNWVITDGVVQSNKTNVSGRSRVNCNTIIIYPNSEDVFNRIFQRYKIQVELGPTATSYAPYSNECPISGWTACNVVRTGKNLAYSQINNTVVARAKKGVTYTLSFDGTDRGANVRKNTSTGDMVATGANPLTFTADEDFDIFLNAWNSAFSNLQVELGSSATTYEAYSGDTYTINFVDGSNPLIVYGGTLNVLSGLLTITDGYISSYNGETLPSTWISDRDVYAEGTTPTTGAEVCYKLATPQTYQLTPTEVKSLLGVNNIFADTGEVDVQIWTKEV